MTQPAPSYEFWIWTELLAFDCTAPDYGVGDYLRRVGTAPTGISLLLSSIDLFLQNPGMDEEVPLPPDICARFGHSGNEERQRQVWTNYALRGLVQELQRHSIKVLAGFFIVSMHNKFHREYVADHPELRMGDRVYGIDNAFSIIARLKNGTLFEDILVPAIVRACQDYGFDGWHGADGQGPGWNLTHSDTSDSFFYQFAESLPTGTIPADLMAPADHDQKLMDRRLDFVWENFHHEWADFTSRRWLRLWEKVTTALHAIHRVVMINSPFAKSIFEGIYYFGLDYRKLPDIGVDYLLTESVTTSCSLNYGGYERVFDFSAMIAEMRAILPGMKVIVMPGVKDVVESYDALRHAPMRLERDIFANVSQAVFDGQQDRRAADGCLVCLGDGITAPEWSTLRRTIAQSFAFPIAQAGEAGWLLSPELFDAMRTAYDKHGTWPPYQISAQLWDSEGLDITCAVPAQFLNNYHRPLVVPHFDLFSTETQKIVLARKELTILFGNLRQFPALPGNACTLCTTEIDPEYTLVCVVLNAPVEIPLANTMIPNSKTNKDFFNWNQPYFRFISTRIPRMEIPCDFWAAAGKAMRQILRAHQPESQENYDGFRLMNTWDKTHRRQLALLSTKETYVAAKLKITPMAVEKKTAFPYSPLQITEEGVLALRDHLQPLHLPPYGLVLAELSTNSSISTPKETKP